MQKNKSAFELKGNKKRRGSWVVDKKFNFTNGIPLVGDKTGCKIILHEVEHSAVKQAARFLAFDIEKITGFLPPVFLKTTSQNDNGSYFKILQSGAKLTEELYEQDSLTPIYMATIGSDLIPEKFDLSEIQDQWEAHKIVTADNSVWILGADFRGTAFGTYVFCERIGIDPLYLWTGYEPEISKSLRIKEINYVAHSPTFRYRGFFHDDEDVLPRPFENSGYPLRSGDINLKWYQKYFETALRLRMNMVAPYTRVHRRYEVQQCASDWGLFYTSHHYDILLSNPFGFEIFKLAEKRNINPEWNWFTNSEGMINYWKAGVWENKDLDCIWPVGLRGLGDREYPFPADATREDQDKVFSSVINAQVEALNKMLPCDQPKVSTFTLFREMLDKYDSDRESFYIPDDVIIVWSDNNAGVMDRLPKELGKWKHGIYYHLAVAGFDATIQSTHVVNPHTVVDELKKVIDAGATEYMLVNVSELREFVMEERLLAEISWDADSVLNSKNAANQYVQWWANEYFGSSSIKDVIGIYGQYYKLLTNSTSVWFAAEKVSDILESLVKKFKKESYKSVDNKDIKELKDRDREYQKAMDCYNRAVKNMDFSQQQFFFEHALLGLCFDWRPTQAALKLCQALHERDHEKAWQHIHDSIKPLEQLELEILRAERSPFHAWYRETWIRNTTSKYNLHRSYNFVRAFIASCGKEFLPSKRKARANVPQYQVWSDLLDRHDK